MTPCGTISPNALFTSCMPDRLARRDAERCRRGRQVHAALSPARSADAPSPSRRVLVIESIKPPPQRRSVCRLIGVRAPGDFVPRDLTRVEHGHRTTAAYPLGDALRHPSESPSFLVRPCPAAVQWSQLRPCLGSEPQGSQTNRLAHLLQALQPVGHGQHAPLEDLVSRRVRAPFAPTRRRGSSRAPSRAPCSARRACRPAARP